MAVMAFVFYVEEIATIDMQITPSDVYVFCIQVPHDICDLGHGYSHD